MNCDDSEGFQLLFAQHSLLNQILEELRGGVAGATLEGRRQWAGFKLVSIGQESRQMFEIGAKDVPFVALEKLLLQAKGAHWGPLKQTAWSADILGPLPKTKDCNMYVLVASDYFTRWAESYPSLIRVKVVQELVDEMFYWFSTPQQPHSNQGHQRSGT